MPVLTDPDETDADETDPDEIGADETGRAETARAATPTAHGATLTRVLAVLVALAALAALFFGTRWALALTDDGRELAEARDAVLVDARQAAININTLDFADVEAGLDLWEQSSTGPVLEEFRANREEYGQAVAQARRATEATVVDAAVAELDQRAGVARVLVGVDVRVFAEGQQPVLTRQRLQLEMTRTDEGWKASRVAPVR
jgi:Mce-associated membrane protein